MKYERRKSELPPTSASRNISGWRHTQVKTDEAEWGKQHGGPGSEAKKEMVRGVATRTRPFLAELLISSCEGKKNEKSKVFLQKIKGKRSN